MKVFMLCVALLAVGLAQVQVTIQTFPTAARIQIDGRTIGNSPQYNIPLNPGPHQFDLSRNGFAPIHYRTVIQEAARAELTFTFRPVYKVKFVSREDNLQYSIDDVVWSEKRVILYLEEGDHELIVKRGNTIIGKQFFTITEPTKIVYRLRKS